ncbi:MAG: hypothetical protein PHD11_03900 [Bacteroidales bacterium]|nr:hypothetical protein [Bacteroidales bacterium]MDD4670357.1 hypothetical protein [Bacteroidales bacterium]
MTSKRLMIVALSLFFCVAVFGQDYFFSTDPHHVSTYQNYDAAGNKIGHYDEKTVSMVGDITNGSMTFDQHYYDKDGKPVFREGALFKLKISIVEGELSAYIESVGKALAVQDMMAKGNVAALPLDMRAGDRLEDTKMHIQMGKTKGTITLKNRKVLAIEKVTTPAGTFDSYKVSETQTIKVLVMTSEVEIVSWFVKGLGCVRQETFDRHGKLQNWLQIVSVGK